MIAIYALRQASRCACMHDTMGVFTFPCHHDSEGNAKKNEEQEAEQEEEEIGSLGNAA